MSSQSQIRRAKLKKIPDVLPGEHIVFGVRFSCLDQHIVRSVSTDKVYVSEQTLSRLHLMRFSQLPKDFVVYAKYGLRYIGTRGKRSPRVGTELHMGLWN